jgi:hypothetical protein
MDDQLSNEKAINLVAQCDKFAARSQLCGPQCNFAEFIIWSFCGVHNDFFKLKLHLQQTP